MVAQFGMYQRFQYPRANDPSGSLRRSRRRAAARINARNSYSGPNRSSNSSRSILANAGLAPPVDIANCKSPRFTTDGAMKVQKVWTVLDVNRNFQLARFPRCLPGNLLLINCDIHQYEIAKRPGIIRGREICRSAPHSASAVIPGPGSCVITVTVAPASISARALRAAASPPPTTRH